MLSPLPKVLLFLCLTSVVATASDEVPGKEQKFPIVFKNAVIHTASSGVLANASLVCVAGRITEIGTSVTEPRDAVVIDCQEKHLYPGFIAPNTTLGLSEIDAVRSTRDMSEVGDFNPNARAETAYNPDSELIPTVRSNGILIANVVPTGELICGTASIMRLDGWTREDIAIVPRAGLIVTWPSMEVSYSPFERKSVEEQRKEISEHIQKLESVFRDARTYSSGAVKNIDSAKRDIRMEAMRPVFEKKMSVFINASSQRQIESALDFAERFDLKVIIVGGTDSRYVADRLKKANIPVILQRVHSMPARAEDGYDAAFTLPAELAKAGVEFCLSDGGAWQQRNLPFQAGTATAFGLTNDQALASVTISAARILGIDSLYGSLEVGKSATLFLSEGDALDGRSNVVVRAFIDGREVELNDRHKRLAKKYRERFAR